MSSIIELVSNRSQNTSAPLKLCFSLYYSMLLSNNIKNEIGITRDASSKRNSIELQLETSFQYCPSSCELMSLALPQCLELP